MIRFGDEDRAVTPAQGKRIDRSTFFVNSDAVQVSTTQDGVVTVSGLGLKKVVVLSRRTIPIVRRNE